MARRQQAERAKRSADIEAYAGAVAALCEAQRRAWAAYDAIPADDRRHFKAPDQVVAPPAPDARPRPRVVRAWEEEY